MQPDHFQHKYEIKDFSVIALSYDISQNRRKIKVQITVAHMNYNTNIWGRGMVWIPDSREDGSPATISTVPLSTPSTRAPPTELSVEQNLRKSVTTHG